MVEVKAKESPAAAAVPPPSRSFFGPLAGIFLDSRKQLNLKLLNAVLFAGMAVLVIQFGRVIDSSYRKIRSIDFSLKADASGENKEKTVLRKMEYYLEKVKKRDIFRMGMAARPIRVETGPSSKALDATQNLKLVGISWSDNPDAMVEDIKALKTFFVKKGQSIGEVKVENITREKVILRYGQELIELR